MCSDLPKYDRLGTQKKRKDTKGSSGVKGRGPEGRPKCHKKIENAIVAQEMASALDSA